jgi:N-acetylglucosaminyldiphosphoundecaprenol N-acetyl-beta-D-mannosaminyltransferase
VKRTIDSEAPPTVAIDHGAHVLRPRRATVLGCEIDRLTFADTLRFCERLIDERGTAQHVAVNVAKLVSMQSDPDLREGVVRSELVTADGQPVVWASRLLGDPLPGRVTGIDLMHGLLASAATRGYRVYLLGAKADILERAVANIRQRFPGIQVVGHRHGYWSEDEEDAVISEIVEARPDILFVALPSPRKEYFLANHRDHLSVPFVMGVGGSIDVVAGARRRAPKLLQRIGLEWLFRLIQEPRRLMGRYVKTNARFVLLVISEMFRR